VIAKSEDVDEKRKGRTNEGEGLHKGCGDLASGEVVL